MRVPPTKNNGLLNEALRAATMCGTQLVSVSCGATVTLHLVQLA